jgi:hypothetical protein
MDSKLNAPSREAQSWLKFCQATLQRAEAAIILGLHSSEQIQVLLDSYPTTSFTVVDPDREQIKKIAYTIRGSLSYVTNQSGLLVAQKFLREAPLPIAVLCYRPRWAIDRSFFETAHNILIEADATKAWHGRSEEFILRGLFR